MARHVTAPLVTAKVVGGGVLTLYRGDVVPDAVLPESLEHLDSLGFLGDDDAPAKPKRSTKTD